MVYKYKTHDEIPAYMRDYILDVSDSESVEQIDVQDINDFLNGLEEWMGEIDFSMPTIH
jgi:hypothetical protein